MTMAYRSMRLLHDTVAACSSMQQLLVNDFVPLRLSGEGCHTSICAGVTTQEASIFFSLFVSERLHGYSTHLLIRNWGSAGVRMFDPKSIKTTLSSDGFSFDVQCMEQTWAIHGV